MADSADRCLSRRALTAQAEKPGFLGLYAHHCMANMYHAERNPTGIVNMGIAESTICEDIIADKFRESKMNIYQPHMQYYFKYAGLDNFREAIAKFLTERFHAKQPVSADNMVVTCGASGGLDYLAFCLADPEEYFLLFSPCYVGFHCDVGFRAKVNIFEIPLPTEDRDDALAYEQNVSDLAAAHARLREQEDAKYQKGKNVFTQGKTVRAVIIVTPHNPTGNIVRRHKLLEMLDYCARHKLHVIMNEMYALSVFAAGARFDSVLSLDRVPDPDRLHLLWGYSKDFALSGMRCGVIHSRNALLTRDRGELDVHIYLGCVPPIVQEKLRVLITDKEWLDNTYFPTNRKGMQAAYKLVTEKFQELGIEYYKKSQAAFFVWANFKKYLPSGTEEAELSLFRRLFQAGLYIVPGTALKAVQAGWFRVTFTSQLPTVHEGLRRLESVLQMETL